MRSSEVRGLMIVAPVLLLQAPDLVHVDGVELCAALLFVGRKLFLVQRLKSNRAFAEPDNNNPATLLVALVVLLVGEGNMDLRDVVRGVWRLLRVGQHGLAVLEDDDTGPARSPFGLDGQTAMVSGPLDLVILRKGVVAHLLLASHSPQDHEESTK